MIHMNEYLHNTMHSNTSQFMQSCTRQKKNKKKKKNNDQELIESDPISCPQNQKERTKYSRSTKGTRGIPNEQPGHSAT